jgi:sarcosine oxidase subunit alpha
MTCRVPAAEGIKIETQNVVGSRERDLLRMADWFFPEGMNHHELLAGVPGIQRVMQAFARRIAGLGRLPGQVSVPRPASRRTVDALVVGAGPSGMAVALALAEAGRRVEVLEEDSAWGGSLLSLEGASRRAWQPLLSSFREAVIESKLTVRTGTVAWGLYDDDLAVLAQAGVELLTAATLVLATGAHDGVLAFPGNDLPGVLSARAAGRVAALGVTVGDAVVVAVAPGGGPFGEAFARAHPEATLIHGSPVRVAGGTRVTEAILATSEGERQLRCDALVIDAPRAPAYELCAQAGAELALEAGGYVVKAPEGRIGPGVFASGEVVGTALDPGSVRREAQAIARQAVTE